MIKIIKGIYGYKETNGSISPKTAKDDPFSLTESQEERLVKKGVAVYVEDEEVAPVQPLEVVLAGNLEWEQLKEMNAKELKQVTKEMGLSTEGKKEKLVERILAAKVEKLTDEDLLLNGAAEQPPVLEPEIPE